MSESTDVSEPSIKARGGLLYKQWQRSPRGLDYEQWRKNQLGVGFEQWILDQPGVEYEKWVKTQLSDDYERLITVPLAVKPPPRTGLEYWAVGIVPLAISFFIFGCLTVLAFIVTNLDILPGFSDLVLTGPQYQRTIRESWSLIFLSSVTWAFMLPHERTTENQIAALESRPDDMTSSFWRSLQMGYRRRKSVSKRQGLADLATFMVVVVVMLAGWTLFAVELLDKIWLFGNEGGVGVVGIRG